MQTKFVNEKPEWFHWTHRRRPFYTYLRHVHVLDHGHFTDIVIHCFPPRSLVKKLMTGVRKKLMTGEIEKTRNLGFIS